MNKGNNIVGIELDFFLCLFNKTGKTEVTCRTPCTLEICYGLIPPLGSNILKPIIPSKPRLQVRFG